VDGAIHRAAGPELALECLQLHGCKVGQAKITRGYRLPAKHIIHTVGPVWQGGHAGEEELLASCYRQSFLLAEKHSLHTLAFPAISTGIYRFPVDLATSIALRETQLALAQNPSLESVLFVCFEERVYQTYLEQSSEGRTT
jgi:O-acetyl-ADP-ribose deacetylase (regulator of RNase III)